MPIQTHVYPFMGIDPIYAMIEYSRQNNQL